MHERKAEGEYSIELIESVYGIIVAYFTKQESLGKRATIQGIKREIIKLLDESYGALEGEE